MPFCTIEHLNLALMPAFTPLIKGVKASFVSAKSVPSESRIPLLGRKVLPDKTL
jgi:hypothetical protein